MNLIIKLVLSAWTMLMLGGCISASFSIGEEKPPQQPINIYPPYPAGGGYYPSMY